VRDADGAGSTSAAGWMGAGDHRPGGHSSDFANRICLNSDGIAPRGAGRLDGLRTRAVSSKYFAAAKRRSMRASAAGA